MFDVDISFLLQVLTCISLQVELTHSVFAYFSRVVVAVTFQRCSDQKKGVGVLTLQQLYFTAIMLLLLKYDHPSPTPLKPHSKLCLRFQTPTPAPLFLSDLSSAPPPEFLQPWLPKHPSLPPSLRPSLSQPPLYSLPPLGFPRYTYVNFLFKHCQSRMQYPLSTDS